MNTNIFELKGITGNKFLKCSLFPHMLGRLKLRITYPGLKYKLNTKTISGQTLDVFLSRQQEKAVGIPCPPVTYYSVMEAKNKLV